jgi:hypothetical protein
MTIFRPLLPILAAALLGGIANAGEFSLGSANMLAENSAQGSVDVTVHFADRGVALRETAEGGDAAPRDTRTLRGADQVASPEAPIRRAATPVVKSAEHGAAADSPHGASISSPAAVRRPSYRWQSLVPGTIK